jgi:hypothetical protein
VTRGISLRLSQYSTIPTFFINEKEKKRKEKKRKEKKKKEKIKRKKGKKQQEQ